MGEEAYHGLAGEIVRTIEPESEADPVAILVQMLAMFGNKAYAGDQSSGPHAIVGQTRHYANLFTVIVADSAKGRKGTSADVTKAIFGDAILPRIGSGLTSGEGLIARVTDAVKRHEPIKDKSGRVVDYQDIIDTPAAKDKRLIALEPEFAQMLQVMRRDGNNLNSVVRNAWDHSPLSVMTKVPRRATGAHISIIGHITIAELKKLFLSTDLFNGFANRFIWIAAKRSKLLPDGGKHLDLSGFRARITEAVTFAQRTARVSRDEGAAEFWDGLYRGELAREYPGILGAVTARAEAQVLRLSLIYALLDKSPMIRVDHLRAALAVWRYSFDSAKAIFGESTGNDLADKLLAAIRERSRNTTELYKVDNNHASKEQLQTALQTLVDGGLVRCETRRTGGAPAKVWHATR
jgi:hypothetical protein